MSATAKTFWMFRRMAAAVLCTTRYDAVISRSAYVPVTRTEMADALLEAERELCGASS